VTRPSGEDLYVVRSQPVPVDELEPGMRLLLPGGREVTVERVDVYDDVGFVVRWFRPAERGEPGIPRRDAETWMDAYDGRYLGSLIPVPAGHCWSIAT